MKGDSAARIKMFQPALKLTNQTYKVQQTCLQNRRKLIEIDIPDKQHVHEIQLDLWRKEQKKKWNIFLYITSEILLIVSF